MADTDFGPPPTEAAVQDFGPPPSTPVDHGPPPSEMIGGVTKRSPKEIDAYLGQAPGYQPSTKGPGILGALGESAKAVGGAIANVPISAAQAADQLVYGTGGLLPGAIGRKSQQLAEATTTDLEKKKLPEPNVDVPLIGNISASGIVGGAAPYAMATALTGGAAAAAQLPTELSAAVSVLGPIAAPLIARIKNAVTPEEKRAATQDATKALMGQLILHGAIHGVPALAEAMTSPTPPSSIQGTGPRFSPEQENFYQSHTFQPHGINDTLAIATKNVVREPNGDVVAELAPADQTTRMASDSVITKKYGTNDLQKIADKWAADNKTPPVTVATGTEPISKTEMKGDAFHVSLSDRDAHPTGLMHELELHVPGENGIPLAEVLPHDDSTNQVLAEAFIHGGGKPPEIPYAGFPGSSGGMDGGPGDRLNDIANINPDASRGVFATIRDGQIKARQTFMRNLVDLEQRLPQAADLASEKEGAPAMARVAALGGHTQIQKVLGGTPADLELFHAALADSEQMGNRIKMRDIAEKLREMPEEEFAQAYKNGAFQTIISSVASKRPFKPLNVLSTLKSMTTGQQQIFLGTLFDTAAENVKPILLPGYKDAGDYFNREPGAKEGLRIYKDVFADQLERSHLENNGILSDEKYHGPSGVYYPMRGVNDGQPTGLFARLRSPIQTTRNIHNFVQTGLSDRYDVTPKGFVDSFRGAISSNARNAMLKALYDSPLFEDVPPGETAPDLHDFGRGQEQVHVEPMPGRTIIRDGKLYTEPTKYTMMPKLIWNELQPILDKPMSDPSFFKRLTNLSTGLNIVGPLEPIYHSANLLGGMMTHAPIVGPAIADGAIKGIASRGWKATPWTKMAWSVAKAIQGDIRDPETLAAYQRAAKRGLLPAKFGTKTLSRELAGLTGADKTILPFSPFLYGPNGIDGKMRVALMRVMESMPKTTEADIRQANSHLGIYNPGLASRFEAGLKGTGLAPFATASKTALANGIDAVLNVSRGTPLNGAPLDVAASRIAQQLAAGLGGYVGWHFLMHKLSRDDWPWEDPNYKVGKIRLTPSQRASYPAVKIFGPDTSKDAYIDPVGSIVSPIPRALRALGIAGTVDTAIRGGDASQMLDAAKRDVINSLLHVTLNSPAIKIGADQIFHKEPQIRNLRERSGKPTVDFYDSRGILSAANPFGGGIVSGAKEEQEGHDLLRFLIDLSMPRVMYGPINNDYQRSFLEAQQAAMARGEADAQKH